MTDERYTPVDEPLAAKVARLDERTFNLGQSMAKIETETTSQSAKLDILIADLHTRKGAAKQRHTLGRAAFTVATGTGFLGWIWEHFHK